MLIVNILIIQINLVITYNNKPLISISENKILETSICILIYYRK